MTYTPTDPVTGLPILNVPDVVDQIPLSKQVVPWDDLAATSRPPQGPAYPNDMLNTLSYVTGESVTSPGSMHAATMTDDRRLRVDTGGGGSSILAAPYMFNLQWEEEAISTFADIPLVDAFGIKYIQGVSCTIGYYAAGNGVASFVISAAPPGHFNRVILASAPRPNSSIAGTPGYATFVVSATFWPVMDVEAMWGTTDRITIFAKADDGDSFSCVGQLYAIPV